MKTALECGFSGWPGPPRSPTFRIPKPFLIEFITASRTAAHAGCGPAVWNLYAAAGVGEPCPGCAAESGHPVQLLARRGAGDHRQRQPRVPRNGEPELAIRRAPYGSLSDVLKTR